MLPNTVRSLYGAVLVALAACFSVGCEGNSRSVSDFVPSSTGARECLEAALTAWKSAEQPGKIRGATTAIQAVDFQWQSGKRLQSYEILDQSAEDGPVWFSVRLTLDDADGSQVARYVVVGLNPLWVFREEDYTKVAAMDHQAPPPVNHRP